jgi:hypothetical protein
MFYSNAVIALMLAAYMYLNKKAFSIREIIKPSALKKV